MNGRSGMDGRRREGEDVAYGRGFCTPGTYRIKPLIYLGLVHPSVPYPSLLSPSVSRWTSEENASSTGNGSDRHGGPEPGGGAPGPGSPRRALARLRRCLPPPSLLHRYLQFDALDPVATLQALSSLSPHVTHLFWLALQPHLSESANISSNSAMLSNVLRSLPSAHLRHVTLQTGTKHYMGPDIRHPSPTAPPPFREDIPRHPHPNFYYALEDLLLSFSSSPSYSFTWSVHRSSIILGASSRSRYNSVLTLAAYALICRRERSPFRFPGTAYTWEHFCDASDAGVLAQQHIWAATTAAAQNQAFNCTNGDVFTWRAFWEAFAEVFGVEPAGPDGDGGDVGFVEEMRGKGGVWEEIVRENGLVETKLEEITCFDALFNVLNFGFQHVCCMNKSREFGFLVHVDTLKSLRKWVERYREMNILPKT